MRVIVFPSDAAQVALLEENPENGKQIMKHDVTNFKTQVLDRSFEIPVLVDFWAEWCGPCRILGPTLERLADNANGDWELAKLNTEEFPDIAVQYGVRSIPNVKLFVDGKPVDEFVGALAEAQVEYWLKHAIPSRNRKVVDHAEALLAEGNVPQAIALLKDVLAAEPANSKANALLAQHLAFADPRAAFQYAERITDFQFLEIADAVRVIAHLKDVAADSANIGSGEAAALYRMAAELLLRQQFDAALQKFIGVIRLDRRLDDEGARRACIAIFKILGEEHELTRKHRRDFSNALY